MRWSPFLSLVLFVGCFASNGEPDGPPYGLQFVNFTDHDVQGAGYSYPGGVELGRRVQARNFATTFPGRRPIPETVHFSWTTADGERHEQEVSVAQTVPHPARFDGTIIFEIRDGGVSVLAVDYDGLVDYDEHKLPRPLPTTVPTSRIPGHN